VPPRPPSRGFHPSSFTRVRSTEFRSTRVRSPSSFHPRSFRPGHHRCAAARAAAARAAAARAPFAAEPAVRQCQSRRCRCRGCAASRSPAGAGAPVALLPASPAGASAAVPVPPVPPLPIVVGTQKLFCTPVRRGTGNSPAVHSTRQSLRAALAGGTRRTSTTPSQSSSTPLHHLKVPGQRLPCTRRGRLANGAPGLHGGLSFGGPVHCKATPIAGSFAATSGVLHRPCRRSRCPARRRSRTGAWPPSIHLICAHW